MENEENQSVVTEETNDTIPETESTPVETDEVTTEQEESKDEDYRGKLNAQNRFLKSEGYEFTNGKWVKPQQRKTESKPETVEHSLSAKDAILLAKANVELDDIDEVLDYAKYRKITIAEALKNPTLKAILADKVEERRTAQATITRSPRSTPRQSPEALIDSARSGKISDKEADIDALVNARMEGKLKK